MEFIVRLVLVSNKRGHHLPVVMEDWTACPVSVSYSLQFQFHLPFSSNLSSTRQTLCSLMDMTAACGYWQS